MKVIVTERLVMRTWKDEDILPYHEINQDPKVIEFLPGPMTVEEVQNFVRKQNENFNEQNFCLFAVERRDTQNFIGFIGLSRANFEAHFTPCVEIGWRLGSQHWNKGYATEGAKAALQYGFEKCALNAIVSFTTVNNVRSIRVMERIGMQRDIGGEFHHPKLAFDHPLSKHILYRMQKP